MKRIIALIFAVVLLFSCNKENTEKEKLTSESSVSNNELENVEKENKHNEVEKALQEEVVNEKTERYKKFEITDLPVLFHGKPLAFGFKTYSRESFEKEFGKSSEYVSYPPGAWHLSYYNEGITVLFTEKNVIDRIRFNMDYFDEVTIFDCKIKKGETYKSIRKRLKDQNRLSRVTEYIKSAWLLEVDLDIGSGPLLVRIYCKAGEDGKVTDVSFSRVW